jgi:MoaA/NifB/PqqE/SkfB family radical SAM enzyme
MSEFVRRVERSAKNIPSLLAQLDIELTERCNNDCIHCCINRPANDADARAREMTTAQVKEVLRQAADLGCLRVRFTGGEPLLRTDFEELYIFARQMGLKVLLFTNGRLIDPHLADLFARMPPLATVEITVYGMSQSSYEAVTRTPGSFAQFRRGVDLLLGRKVPFVVKSVPLPQNMHEIAEFEAWAKTIPWMNGSPTYAMFLDLRHRHDNAEKDAVIKSLRVPSQDKLALLTRDAKQYRREMAEFASKFMGPRGEVLFHCGAGKSICVDAYGRAQPCLSLRAPELTVNLISTHPSARSEGEPATDFSASEKEVMAGGLAAAAAQFSQLSRRRAQNSDYLRRCAQCFLKGLCEQCPAKSWMEHGNLDTPVEYLCEGAHAQARYLGWLNENESGWGVRDWRMRLNGEDFSGLGTASPCDLSAH